MVALVVATPINLLMIFFGGLNASLDHRDPPALIAAEIVALIAAGSAVTVLIVTPLLGDARLSSAIGRGLRRVGISAALSPALVLILVLASR